MIVDLSTGRVVVSEADDLKRLKVAAPEGLDVGQAIRSSGMGGGGADDRVLLGVAALRSAAWAAASDPAWEAGWDAMVAYAASKGWVTDDGAFLVAHVERTP